MQKKDWIRRHLRDGLWLCTARGLATTTGASPAYVRKVLADLRREGVLKQELTDGGRPFRYWVEEK